MQIKFTQEEMDAIEVAYYDNEGTLPDNMDHIPEQENYQVLQQLWLKMANKMNKKRNKQCAKSLTEL